MRNEVDELIPPPEAVKYRLAVALRETMLLRRLLRLSEFKERLEPAEHDRHSKAQTREGTR